MNYILTFLEGVISFISPCMLPMLPVYVMYFAAGSNEKKRAFINSAAFVLGFTCVFCALGVFAGTLGRLLTRYRLWVRITGGVIVCLFGLSYMGVFRLGLFKGAGRAPKIKGAAGAFLFGLVYSVSLTPCVGAFLGSALTLASTTGSALAGCLLLGVYSLGLGIPFVLSALLIEQLKGLFGLIKRSYRVLNIVCGALLILTGILMAAGVL